MASDVYVLYIQTPVHDDKKPSSRLRLEWYVHQYEIILVEIFLDSEYSMRGRHWSASPSTIDDTVLKEREKSNGGLYSPMIVCRYVLRCCSLLDE